MARLAWIVLVVILGVVIVRPFLPQVVRWYVNRILDQSVLYHGTVGDVTLHLWRGAYSIENVKISKTTGNIPVPFFAADQVDLAVQWDALLHGKVVGRVLMVNPQVNFVDDPQAGNTETGAGGPWMKMLRDLFPFDLNRVVVQEGDIHFRTYAKAKPVDVYLSHLNAEVDDLTNVSQTVQPLMATVHATATAMDNAKFEFLMKLDPFSYDPTFHLGLRLLALDMTQINDLTKSYAGFDIKRGRLDLVMEVDAKEGVLQGYVKPLFRNMVVFDLVKDVQNDNVFQVFWTAIVGTATAILTNYNRDQFGTVIPFTGDMKGPQPDFLATVGNVLRNAFIRAYLPRMENNTQRVGNLEFSAPTLTDPLSAGNLP